MKYKIAKWANIALIALGTLFAFTNSYWIHRPETPQEFLKKQ